MGLKRSDNERHLLHAIEDLEKRPQNRQNRRILKRLQARFDKLVPPEPEIDNAFLEKAIVTKPGESLIDAVQAARQENKP